MLGFLRLVLVVCFDITVLSPVTMSAFGSGLSVVPMDCASYSVQVNMSFRGKRPYFDASRFLLVHYVDDEQFIQDEQYREQYLTVAGAQKRR